MSEDDRIRFLSHEIIIEEKIDGANLGISFDDYGNIFCQNRGHRIVEPFEGQWRPLRRWLDSRLDDLFDVIGNRLVLFGEWCYAQHSVSYDALPDWFMLFDVYDKKLGRFYSVQRRNIIADTLHLVHAKEIGRGHYDYQKLSNMTFQSFFGHEMAEGLYFRIDDGDWLMERSKLVRPAFRQSIDEHWSRGGIRPNRRLVEFAV